VILLVDRETYEDAWEDYFEERHEKHVLEHSREFYEDLLKTNLEETRHISYIPEDVQNDIAEMGAKVYSGQIERVMNSTYVSDAYPLAAATAFLQPEKQVKVGAQAQGIVDVNWERIRDRTDYDQEQIKRWVSEVVINPWPDQHFERERVDRFKPPEDDRTFQ